MSALTTFVGTLGRVVRFGEVASGPMRDRTLKVGPLVICEQHYAFQRFTLDARWVFLGGWTLAVGPGDGMTEGIGPRTRVRWLRRKYPQVILSYDPRGKS